MLEINDISKNNLQHITTQLPKHAMTVVTGVAGSGKSSLITSAFEKDSHAIFIDQKTCPRIKPFKLANLFKYL